MEAISEEWGVVRGWNLAAVWELTVHISLPISQWCSYCENMPEGIIHIHSFVERKRRNFEDCVGHSFPELGNYSETDAFKLKKDTNEP